MALHDLTPQLRTRLSRMERAVGLFVILAAALLLFGFGYYIYNTAERKGWFKTKAPYFTFTDRATGLKVGDPVKLMGLDVGQITKMEPMPPENFQYNMYVEFELKDPYFGYLWTEGSRAKVTTADLLGKRVLEVTKGIGGYPTYAFHPLSRMAVSYLANLPDLSRLQLGEQIDQPNSTNVLLKALTPLSKEHVQRLAQANIESVVVLDTRERKKTITAVWNDHQGAYEPYGRTNLYWLMSDETAAVTERLEKLVEQVEIALPNILSLTNQLTAVLTNAADLTSNLNSIAIGARPLVSNLTAVTAQLDRPGALGEWLLPTNINRQLEGLLTHAGFHLRQRRYQPGFAGGKPGTFTGQPGEPHQQSKQPGASQHQPGELHLGHDCPCRRVPARIETTLAVPIGLQTKKDQEPSPASGQIGPVKIAERESEVVAQSGACRRYFSALLHPREARVYSTSATHK